MGKFQIYQDGRAAGANPISGSDFVTKDYLENHSIELDPVYKADSGSLKASASLASASSAWITLNSGSLAVSMSYDSDQKKIKLFSSGSTVVAEIDATAFIKDGMVNTITLDTSSLDLTITFNTDAGKEDIVVPMRNVFDLTMFYTKDETYSRDEIDTLSEPFVSASSWVAENSASIPTERIWIRGTGTNSTVLSGSNVDTNGPKATGKGAVAIGRALASGELSFAHGGWAGSGLGTANTASGTSSHAEGYSTRATGNGSHAEGGMSNAVGSYSHAEGRQTSCSGIYSHAEGYQTIASGDYSHAEGYYTIASGSYSHAEGYYTTASKDSSHAEGFHTIASGSYSHAEGYYTIASGDYSHAEGNFTKASNPYEFTVGRCNATGSSNQIFSVGAGHAIGYRKNAISVLTGSGTTPSASIYIYGVGSYNGTNPQPGVNDLATVISNISASSGGGGGTTSETDPIYLTDSASLKASASLAQSAIQPAATSSWAAAATWIAANSASALAVSPTSVTASVNAAIGAATASHHTHSNKAVLDGITAAKTASWDSKLSSESDPVYLADSASLKASASLAQGIASITASLVASASVAQTASSSAAAIEAKTGSYDALVGLPAVTAADNGKILMVVNGAWALVTPVSIYTGSAAPDSTQGNDGDIYLQS